MPSLLVNLFLLIRWKFQICAIFMVKTLKILIMFFKIVHLFEEFEIELSIIVSLIFYMKVISSLN